VAAIVATLAKTTHLQSRGIKFAIRLVLTAMNLFEWLFTEPAALRRQLAAPLYKQRVAFLTYLKDHDRNKARKIGS
jgi:hypothetical protein